MSYYILAIQYNELFDTSVSFGILECKIRHDRFGDLAALFTREWALPLVINGRAASWQVYVLSCL